MRAACVTSVLYTRVVVYRAQRGERGIGGGEDEAVAKAGAHICSVGAHNFVHRRKVPVW